MFSARCSSLLVPAFSHGAMSLRAVTQAAGCTHVWWGLAGTAQMDPATQCALCSVSGSQGLKACRVPSIRNSLVKSCVSLFRTAHP